MRKQLYRLTNIIRQELTPSSLEEVTYERVHPTSTPAGITSNARDNVIATASSVFTTANGRDTAAALSSLLPKRPG